MSEHLGGNVKSLNDENVFFSMSFLFLFLHSWWLSFSVISVIFCPPPPPPPPPLLPICFFGFVLVFLFYLAYVQITNVVDNMPLVPVVPPTKQVEAMVQGMMEELFSKAGSLCSRDENFSTQRMASTEKKKKGNDRLGWEEGIIVYLVLLFVFSFLSFFSSLFVFFFSCFTPLFSFPFVQS